MTRSRNIADQQDNLGGAVAPFVAGKNKVINGGFDVWQRGTTFSSVSGTYCVDRWTSDAVATVARDVGPSAIPFSIKLSNSTGNPAIRTRIEFSALGNQAPYFNGSTWTVSYWAKRSTGTAPANLYAAFLQSGDGSPVQLTNAELGTVTTSWQRFTHTFTISVTASASADRLMLVPYTNSGSFSGDTWFAGVQLEAGNVATPFTPAGGGFPGAELALCQRYYWRITSPGSTATLVVPTAFVFSSVESDCTIQFPVTMRVAPTSIDYANLQFQNFSNSAFNLTAVTLAANTASPSSALLYGTISGGTTGQVGKWMTQAISGNNYLGFSAEL